MTTHNLKTPISEPEIRRLSANDIVFVSGTVITARDQAHKRALEFAKQGKRLPVDFEGLVVFHCGPVIQKQGEDWVAIAAGPTTSTRMEIYEAEFIERFRPSIIVGKGGMGKRTAESMKKFGAVYCAFTGGAAVIAASSIKRVKCVEWLDLGMPEATWVLEVENFGPLVVAIDSFGNNLFADVSSTVEENKKEIYRSLHLAQ